MKDNLIPVATEGWPFILIFALMTILFFIFTLKILGFAVLTLTLFVCFFFRDPKRSIPEGENVVVSPADGKVVAIKYIKESDFLQQSVFQISIFLSIFNVHINRAPVGGKIETVKYNTGKFHIAAVDKASAENEQTAMVIASGNRKILVKQIAGFIARRIVCYAKPGDVIRQGERYGIIRFGSRVDIFLPTDSEIKVNLGDKVKGAKDIIALLK